MPEITLNFNINITCDPAILNFLKTLQGIKQVETEKIASVPFIQAQADLKHPYPESVTTSTSDKYKMGSVVIFSEEKKEKKPKKQYKLGGERIADEVLGQRIIDYIKKHQPCNLVWDKKTGTFPEDFLNSLKFYGNTKIRKHLIELEEKGLIFRERPSQKGSECRTGRKPYIYSIRDEKPDNTKALSYFKENLKEDKEQEEEEEEEEDVLRADTRIDVPSPERRPKREIKLKCSRCGGQLFKKNTAEENYMDIESRFLDMPVEIYYQCLNCGRVFKEKEAKKEAKAA